MSPLSILDLSELSLPILQCTLYLNRFGGCMSTESRLASQITVVTLTDRDIADYMSERWRQRYRITP